LECVRLLERGQAKVLNRYKRSVAISGNLHAQQLVHEVYEVCDRPWRGLGTVPQGGLALRESWSQFDALRRFPPTSLPTIDSSECRSGDVLTGRIKPTDCEHFAGRCTPENPLGAPMVSAEGACAAYYRYAPPRTAASKE
jgi:hydrogenase expression/formation protein HypD